MVLIRHFVFSENGYASTDEDASEFSQASEGGMNTFLQYMIIMK